MMFKFILKMMALTARIKRSYINFILEMLPLLAVAIEFFTAVVLEMLSLLTVVESYFVGLGLEIFELSVRGKNYLVRESLSVILTDLIKLIVYLILFFICYVVFFGTIATIIVVPKEELVETFMTFHEYDYFGWFLSLPIDVQRNFCLWFLLFVLFVNCPDFYSKR